MREETLEGINQLGLKPLENFENFPLNFGARIIQLKQQAFGAKLEEIKVQRKRKRINIHMDPNLNLAQIN
jgi:hypothetical protein